MITFKEFCESKKKQSTKFPGLKHGLDKFDLEAEREGSAIGKASKNKSTSGRLSQKIFSTHSGTGTRAVGPPTGSRMHKRSACKKD